MRYIITLNKVKRSDLESFGFRAIDLGVLREKRLNLPLTFVINNQAFEDFLAENGLKIRVEKVFQNKKASEAYKEVLDLFSKAVIPKELEEELFEAYASLAIDPGASASSIVSEWDYPFVTLIRSPSYLLSTEDTEGVIQNLRGKNALLKALRLVWASIYSPKSVDYRKSTGINDSSGMGVLVQKMMKIKQSAVSYSSSDFDEDTVTVKSFIGFQDYDSEKEILGKDHHEVDSDTLMIKRAKINVQEYSLVRSAETGELIKHELREQGSRQKLDDKQVAEVARITKRARSFIGKDLKLCLGVRDDYTYILLANRIISEPKRVVEEKEEVKLIVDDEGNKIMEHTIETVGGQEKPEGLPELPKIISEEEAREEVFKEERVEEEVKEEVKEEVEEEKQVPAEELEKDLEFLEEIEKEEVKEEGVEEGVEKEVEREVNLLEEVIKIKDIIERMEEHALNNNKEAYAQEAKMLKEMISRVREES